MARDVHAPIEDENYDFLGRKRLARKVYIRLSDANCPPAIGIYGGWGTGKSSVLKLIYRMNDKEIQSGNGLFIKEIDAWAYELVGSLFSPIIVTLKTLAEKEFVSGISAQKYMKRLRKFVLLGASDVVLRKLGLSLEDAKKLIADAETESADGINYLDWKNVVDDAESTRNAFKELINVALLGLKKEGKYRSDRIVFCIDNLDRCSPENAIHLLESIRNFLSVPGCIWVLAVDSDVIASYVFKKYDDAAVDGYSYLDKIVPEQYHLSLSPTMDREGIVKLLNSVEGFSNESRVSIEVEKIPQIPKVLVPRRLIKSVSKFYEYYKDPLEVSPSRDMLLKLSFLYHTWPAFYQRLSSASKEHIRGILDNFIQKKQDKTAASPEKKAMLVSLDSKFLDDKELVYFIQLVFDKYDGESSDRYINDIIDGIKALRQVGLP